MKVLQVKNLAKKYKNKVVIKDVSLQVKQGEIVGLLGPNGAGKTTCFYMVVGLVKADNGVVIFDEKDITKLPVYQRAQLGIGYLPQENSIFRGLSVAQNILAILEIKYKDKKQRLARLDEILKEFSITHIKDSHALSLSGGERRRVEIARCIACDPDFILLDEPFAGIDPLAVEDIQYIVAKLKTKGIGILITDHNVQETLSITDRAYLMFEGRILRTGTAEQLAEDEIVRKVYLGQQFELRKKNIDV